LTGQGVRGYVLWKDPAKVTVAVAEVFMVFSRAFLQISLVGACAVLACAGCHPLERQHTFKEDENIRIRAKNLHSYYLELEEAIQLEQYQIKLLQDTLNLKLTEEQTLADQIQQKGESIKLKNKDKANLDAEISGLETNLKALKDKRKSLEGELKAEQEQTGGIEKSIADESGRIGKMRSNLSGTLDQLDALEKEMAQKQQVLESLKKKGAEIDAVLREQLIQLGMLPKEAPSE
jgi:chromosome segregation ATPase